MKTGSKVWRHGDRAPVASFTNLSIDTTEFPNGTGALTEVGFMQALDLGERIRRRYFEHRNVSIGEVFIRSTNMSRTVRTAEGIISALHMPELKVVVDSPMEQDTIGNPLFACPLADRIVAEWGDEYLMKDNYSDAHKMELPQWAKNDTLKEAMRILSWTGLEMQYGIEPFRNDTLMKIRSGSILRNVVEQLYSKIQNAKNNNTATNTDKNSDLYFYGLSAHDITLTAILSTFRNMSAITGPIPHVKYAANLAFELYVINGKYKIKILYANQYDEEPKDVTRLARGCEDSRGLCDANKFIEQSRKMFFDDILYANQYDEEPKDVTRLARGCEDSRGLCDANKFIEQSRKMFFDDVQKHCEETSTSSGKDGKKVKRSAGFFSGNLAELFIS
ncbi:Prostatic acid phosphatase [Toxocara canis]|uniref:Prostatic acid phosphatase n=1 Tax=Toxocara canis TaxID=6265 RepID=A0A0B2VMT9_TOXCA|nr:Prostatic acid phosphatase [Toxocara canis]